MKVFREILTELQHICALLQQVKTQLDWLVVLARQTDARLDSLEVWLGQQAGYQGQRRAELPERKESEHAVQ